MKLPFLAVVAGFAPVCLSFTPHQRSETQPKDSSFSMRTAPKTTRKDVEAHMQADWGADASKDGTASNIPADSADADGSDGSGKLKASRFSKFAPDADLPADDFRAQLKENMKKDLERRRREDPNRGNQPAKNYLDNL